MYSARLALRPLRLLLLLSGCFTISFVSGAQRLPGWTLVWQDEFTQADGTSPNPAHGGCDLGTGGWGNDELQSDISNLSNARITNIMRLDHVRVYHPVPGQTSVTALGSRHDGLAATATLPGDS